LPESRSDGRKLASYEVAGNAPNKFTRPAGMLDSAVPSGRNHFGTADPARCAGLISGVAPRQFPERGCVQGTSRSAFASRKTRNYSTRQSAVTRCGWSKTTQPRSVFSFRKICVSSVFNPWLNWLYEN
jgi:hypothetical protein